MARSSLDVSPISYYVRSAELGFAVRTIIDRRVVLPYHLVSGLDNDSAESREVLCLQEYSIGVAALRCEQDNCSSKNNPLHGTPQDLYHYEAHAIATEHMAQSCGSMKISDYFSLLSAWQARTAELDPADPFTRNSIFHSNCRGIWVAILQDEEELPAVNGIRQSLRDRFGDAVTDLIQPRKPMTKRRN